MRSTCRSSEAKLRDRWMSAMQEDCTCGRTVLVLCHPANTWNLSENCNLFSSTILKRMTGFCHSKLLQSWTKIYASKTRTSKIWALLNLQLPKKRVIRKHLPTRSLPYDSRYLRFVTETGSPLMWYLIMSPRLHFVYNCSTDVLLPSLQLKMQNSWCRCLWYSHREEKALKLITLIPSWKNPTNPPTKSWVFKGSPSLPLTPVKSQEASVQWHFLFVYYY